MSEVIYTREISMPMSIRAFTVYKDDVYTIIINANLSDEMKLEERRHEMEHIQNGDFEQRCGADLIEIYAHGMEGVV